MAPRTRAQLLADFADNTVGAVTPANLRGLVDSISVRTETDRGRVDVPPYAPTLFGGVNYDQEFATQTVLGGTELGSPATPTALVDGAMRVVSGQLATADFKGREFLCPPSAAFKLTVKVRRNILPTLYNIAQVMLRAGTSGAGTMAGVALYRTTGNWTSSVFASFVYTTLTNRSATRNLDTAITFWPEVYVRIIYDGTNLTYYVSPDGNDDNFALVQASEVAATVLGAAPGRVVLGIDEFSTTATSKAYFEWARFTT
jgi:hypothetical protein